MQAWAAHQSLTSSAVSAVRVQVDVYPCVTSRLVVFPVDVKIKLTHRTGFAAERVNFVLAHEEGYGIVNVARKIDDVSEKIVRFEFVVLHGEAAVLIVAVEVEDSSTL